ncbi:hypothetical protein [Kitasatospora sp. NPDC087271]|uniref:RICIN domain-containing protein n=1 Tax=Kitasatospora sp. NPDC087271 TaxID=3364067 RepID=UPI0037F77A0C
MRSTKKLSALAAGMSAVAVLGLAGPAMADGSYDPAQENCNAANTVTPGSTSLVWCIEAAQHTSEVKNQARGEFVQGTLDMLIKATGGSYNIMVFNIKGDNAFGDPWYVHNYEQSFQNVAFTYDVDYHDKTSREDQTYRIWVFSGGGSFANGFDGGWGNWGFYGLFNRTTREHTWTYPRGTGSAGQRYNHTDGVVNFSPMAFPGVPRDPGTPAPGGLPATQIVPAMPQDPGTPYDPGVPATPARPPHTGKPGEPAEPGTKPGTGTPTGSGRPALNTPVHLRTVNNLGAVATGSGEGASVIAGKPGDAGGTWTFRDAGGGRYRITNALGRDLTENTGTYFANTKGWKGSSEQKWEVKNVSGDRYVIRISDQDCLTYHEDDKELGVWTCDGSAEQQWTITR